MTETKELKRQLTMGVHDALLEKLYVTHDAAVQRVRLTALIEGYEARFGETEVELFSAPGRTELGGNHTDHQHGCVLAASVNLDTVACAAPNGTNIIRIQSEGYPLVEVSLDALVPQPDEKNQTAALIRGMAAAIAAKGYILGGFNAYAVSNVLSGSGLSSSAAYETLIGVILNHLFCNDELDAVEIAKFGQYAENVFFGKPCGLMDQTASSVGNVVAIDFDDPASPRIEEIAFPFADCGHALCIIDSGADHADLTDEYAAVPQEMRWPSASGCSKAAAPGGCRAAVLRAPFRHSCRMICWMHFGQVWRRYWARAAVMCWASVQRAVLYYCPECGICQRAK